MNRVYQIAKCRRIKIDFIRGEKLSQSRIGDNRLAACELCYVGATDEEIAACAVEFDPEGLELKLVEALAAEGIEGNTIVQALGAVQYDENELKRQMKAQMDTAIKSDRLKPSEAMRLLDDYERGLKEYTYLSF